MLRSIALIIISLIVFAGMSWPSVARADSEVIELIWANRTNWDYHVRLVKAWGCVSQKGKTSFSVESDTELGYMAYYKPEECSGDKLFHYYFTQKRAYLFGDYLKADIFLHIDSDRKSYVTMKIVETPYRPKSVKKWFFAYCTEESIYCLQQKVREDGHKLGFGIAPRDDRVILPKGAEIVHPFRR